MHTSRHLHYSGTIVISQLLHDKIASEFSRGSLNACVTCRIDFRQSDVSPVLQGDLVGADAERQTATRGKDLEFTVRIPDQITHISHQSEESSEVKKPITVKSSELSDDHTVSGVEYANKDYKDQANDPPTRYAPFYSEHSDYFSAAGSVSGDDRCQKCTGQCGKDITKCKNPWKKKLLEEEDYGVLVDKSNPVPLSELKWVVVYSRDKNRTGQISTEYTQYSKGIKIGNGGFGRVYKLKYTTRFSAIKTVAVKEENLEPLIYKPKRLKRVLSLCHQHVVQAEEYIIGDKAINDKHTFLFVMPIMEYKGLNEPFDEGAHDCRCLLDYLKKCKGKNIMSYYVRNFLEVAKQIFSALEYFEGEGLVHRDIKRSNILMKKTTHCLCKHPILCCCKSKGAVLCKIADFDLMDKPATMYGKWKTLNPNPGGSKGMIAPEMFFKDDKDCKIFGPNSDVWSASITLMHVLEGKYKNDGTLEQFTWLFQNVSIELPDIVTKCKDSIEYIETLKPNITSVAQFQKTFQEIKESIENMIKFQIQHDNDVKQNIRSPDRKLKNFVNCPIAETLTAFYGVQMLPHICHKELSECLGYSEDVWYDTLQKMCDIMQMGMQFQPKQRLKASVLLCDLQRLSVVLERHIATMPEE